MALSDFQTLAQPRPKYRLDWVPVMTMVTPTGGAPVGPPYTTKAVRYYPTSYQSAGAATNIDSGYFDVWLDLRSTILGFQFYKPLATPPGLRNDNQERYIVFDWTKIITYNVPTTTPVPLTNRDAWHVRPYFDYRCLSDAYALQFAQMMALNRYRTYAPGPTTLWGIMNDAVAPIIGPPAGTPSTWPVIERVLMILWDAS